MNKRLKMRLELLSLSAAALAAMNLGAVELTGANAEIVVAPGAPGSVAFAAREMSDMLGTALGAKVAVVESPTAGKASIVVSSKTWSVASALDTA